MVMLLLIVNRFEFKVDFGISILFSNFSNVNLLLYLKYAINEEINNIKW